MNPDWAKLESRKARKSFVCWQNICILPDIWHGTVSCRRCTEGLASFHRSPDTAWSTAGGCSLRPTTSTTRSLAGASCGRVPASWSGKMWNGCCHRDAESVARTRRQNHWGNVAPWSSWTFGWRSREKRDRRATLAPAESLVFLQLPGFLRIDELFFPPSRPELGAPREEEAELSGCSGRQARCRLRAGRRRGQTRASPRPMAGCNRSPGPVFCFAFCFRNGDPKWRDSPGKKKI